MKMRKRAGKKTGRNTGGKGFDLGTPANYFYVSDPTWMKDITEAEIAGCAYSLENAPDLGRIPGITLIARNEEPLRAAFKTFEKWTLGSDDDAIDVTIILLKAGGYLLGVTPEPDRLEARTPLPPILDRLDLFTSWIKTLDTTHPMLSDLRRYHSALIAPIAFGAALLPSGLIVQTAQSSLKRVSGIRSFIKFSYTFLDEETLPLTPAAEMMLSLHRRRGEKKSSHSESLQPKPTPATWGAKRKKVMREMFPLTMFRARSSNLVGEVMAKFGGVEAQVWQIEQAICNIVLSRVMGASGNHYEGIPSSKLLQSIVDRASKYTEIAGGENLIDGVGPDEVEAQVLLDSSYLVRHLRPTEKNNNFNANQESLRKQGYLIDT